MTGDLRVKLSQQETLTALSYAACLCFLKPLPTGCQVAAAIMAAERPPYCSLGVEGLMNLMLELLLGSCLTPAGTHTS